MPPDLHSVWMWWPQKGLLEPAGGLIVRKKSKVTMGWRSEHWTYAIWSARVLGGKLFSSPSCTFFPHPPVCVRIRRTTNRPGSALVASRGTPSRRVSALEYDTTLAVRLPEAEAPRARLVCPNGSTSKNPSWVLKCVIGVSYRFVMSFEKFRVFRLFFFGVNTTFWVNL